MYCLQCGHELVIKKLDNKYRNICPACGWVYYQQLKVSSAVIIEKDNKILLLKRAHNPWEGFWYLPAGFVEFDEDPKMGGIREVKEEIGLDVQINAMFHEYFYDDDPRGNGLLLVYLSKVLNWNYVQSDEITDYRFFSVHQIPNNLCGAGHRSAILDWIDSKNG